MARKILLADDSVTAQNMGRKILADAGYEVITVNNGSAALKKIAETKPDLIVLDVYMPGYSGLEVCQRLKEAQETSRIPVLLTVGKLEPFKPEEAKRVRADSYIVKPFEASELLSALTKLEDKIVPRAESSKPGRFARNIAAIEEGRYDQPIAPDEESSWKNRIAFPSGKKEKSAEPEDGNDPAIYNALNKDLRTVVEIAPPHQAPSATNEGRVDLAALAPQGLPTEVTPEEIAALAAAAAQVKKSIASKNGHEAAALTATVEEPPAPVEDAADSHGAAALIPADAFQAQAVSEVPSGKIETEIPQSVTAQEISQDASNQNASNPYAPDPYSAEPVTMAAAAGASASRWTAVAVALAPEEAGLSLEVEMQKAYAAFAAAEFAPSEFAPSAPAAVISAPPAATPETPVAEAAAVESHSAVEPASLNELTQTMGEIAAVANDAMRAAVSELEVTASAHIDPTPAVSTGAIALSEVTTADNPAVEAEVPSQTTNADASAESSESPALIPAQEQPPAIPEIVPAPQESAQAIPIDQNHIEAVAEAAATSTGSQAQPAPEVRGEMAKKESEIAEHTAAAWATWRRIRETDHSPSHKPAPRSEDELRVPEDAAAMAVAAGAEQVPEEAFNGHEPDSADIASIVDSVLADLRPKIVEEISRKLAKKK